jgi:hypothetical protein
VTAATYQPGDSPSLGKDTTRAGSVILSSRRGARERVSNDIADGAVLAPGEVLQRVQGVFVARNPLIELPHSGPV